MSFGQFIEDEAGMLAFGGKLARYIVGGAVIYLQGDLGAGKTTLTRGILYGLGYQGAVKSPTFTLVEPYEIGQLRVYHFDLYRLADPEELEYLGIRDYFVSDAVSIIEWPDKGAGVLPEADLQIKIDYQGSGRHINIACSTPRGEAILHQLS